ncbi:PREDICTED: golgin subfamily A member 6-like protein 22, partial [Wasmannia auropunctata]|uniref:golgin subfamily A member 6-like protein 22 n=1 Tax=Wasmannia auropunctata TaxID=64793 RepID=UPI0005EDEBC8
MGNIEEAKRKREQIGRDSLEGEGAEVAFKRSNKTVRSPGEEEGKGELKELLWGWKEEMKREMRGVREEIGRVAEGQKEAMRKEIEKMKEELRVREERWDREREEFREKIERIERELEGLKIEKGEGGKDIGKVQGEREVSERMIRGEQKEWMERVRQLEKRWERKEREDRRKNLLVKGLKEGEGSSKERVEEVLRGLGMEIKIEDIRKLDVGKREKGDMVVVRVGSEDMKRNILLNKWRLKGKDWWIEEDLTWEERRIRWCIRQVAKKEEMKGKRVKAEQRGVWIDG